MKTVFKLWLLLFSFLALNSCSVDKIDPPPVTPDTPAVITTSIEAAQVSSSILQARDFYVTTATLYKDLGEIAVDVMVSDPTVSFAGTDINCADGGSYSYTGTATGTAWDLNLTFSGCRQNRFQYEGSYSITGGTPADLTINLAASGTFNVFYFNEDYTVLIDYLKEEATYRMSGSGSATDASYTILANGQVTNFDYFLLDTFTIAFSQLTLNYIVSTDAVTQDQTSTLIVDGVFAESTLTKRIAVAATGFSIEQVKRYSGGAFTGHDSRVDGTIKFDHSPAGSCFEGVYSVATVTAVHYDSALDQTTLGTMTVNGVATALYNAGGDIDVSVSGSTAINFLSEPELMKMCNFSSLERHIPPLLGATGSTSGSTMAVTLTWYGPSGSTSDMDLHLKFYSSQTPTTGTQETWHMDWHQGNSYPTGGSCTDPSGLSFSDAFDLDGDHSGTCDVGLDFDDTNGYGPEHITALKLLPGYYIASVNSYSLGDPSATLLLAIHVGDSIYGPYTTTLTASDGEGTDAASWFRVADVRVNDDGTVDILTPDATLDPWGTPAH